MKEIQLTQEKVALVDDEDFERLNQFKWCAVKMGNTFYAMRSSPRVNGKRHTIYMHHEIFDKPPKGYETDHRRGNGLNNQKKNLRFVTHRQNGQNRKDYKKTSNYPGVCWNKCDRKWHSYIMINRKRKHLGSFIDEREAFKAYRKAVNEIGEEVLEEYML